MHERIIYSCENASSGIKISGKVILKKNIQQFLLFQSFLTGTYDSVGPNLQRL